MTDLVSPGGSRGVSVLGGEVNIGLTQNILNLADKTINKEIGKTRAAQYLDGKARVAQGESLETIRASQGVYDQIFGTGTLQGANAQSVIQATDEHVLHMQTNMHNYKEQDTDSFVASQRDYVTENLLTGDPAVDNLIVLSSGEAIADSSKIHAKEHAMFVQQKSKFAFESTLVSANTRAHNILSNPTASTQDKLVAVQNLVQRMNKLPAQHQSAHTTSLMETIVAELGNDRPELYYSLVHGKLEVDGQVLDITEALDFGQVGNNTIQEAFTKHRERVDVEAEITKAREFAGLKTLANSDAPLSLLIPEHQKFLRKYGADSLGFDKDFNLYMMNMSARNKVNLLSTRIQEYNDGKSKSDTDQSHVANTADSWEALHMQQVAKLPPEQQAEATNNVVAESIERAVDYQVVPASWTRLWENGFARLEDTNGKPSDSAINAYKHWSERQEKDPVLFESSMSSESLGNLLAVKELMQTEGMPLEEALHRVHAYPVSVEDANKLVSTDAFKKDLDEYIDNPSNNAIFAETDVVNTLEAKRMARQAIVQHIRKTGQMDKSTWPAARKLLKKTVEKVADYQVHNQGTPFRVQAELQAGTFDEAFTHYKNNVLVTDNLFGTAYNPENTILDFTPGYVTITAMDEEGGYAPVLPHRVSIKDIGARYNTDVVKKLQDKAIAEEALRKQVNKETTEMLGVPGSNQLVQQLLQNLGVDPKFMETAFDTTKEPESIASVQHLVTNLSMQLAGNDSAGALRTIEAIYTMSGAK